MYDTFGFNLDSMMTMIGPCTLAFVACVDRTMESLSAHGRPVAVLCLLHMMIGVSSLSLGDWMGQILPVLGNSSLLDLSLPGSHGDALTKHVIVRNLALTSQPASDCWLLLVDTLTYDLSSIVSDGGVDSSNKWSKYLHSLTELGVAPDEIGKFAIRQSQTQALNVTAQLDGGVRFLDLRIM